MRHDKFLQFGSGPGGNRLIIFSSTDQLKILEDTEEVFIDETFKELGLKNAYENDSNFAYDVNKIAALAFLQPSEVSQGFDELYLSLPPILQPLMDYFEDTYIGRRRPNGRGTPRFPIELWNMHQRTINHSMRTNNFAEAWHRRLNSVILYQHPSLWIFIESIQKEQNLCSLSDSED
ncbi:unnamed protein product [Didymodactylos carnosus]|uniref:Uncharacterized protein n=1 Tax=Didymodactylos carnosus TaxID=1234261 RepID=A0A815KMV1_9BILA|nr:unnamed protein product [Didymodactylos carnosus]CAF1395204.1 unnamed protein product [Didymodactylos carnosus]CAF3684347.1 unnamed protein product [Didymodactylos carnosus]CAF4289359.1 unnamed protein product [Didymodactylos carnosus]